MSNLRIILLLIGAGIIAAVYVWTRLQLSSRRSAVKTNPVPTPRFADEEPDAEDVQEQLERMGKLVAERDGDMESTVYESMPQTENERLLIISIVAPEEEPFEGASLLRAFTNNHLRFSDQGIYQRVSSHAGRELQVFGIANLVKPGTFDPNAIHEFYTPGVTLFLQLPCALDGVEAFDDFVNTAERLAVELGGELRNERHEVLTHQVLMQIRESIVAARFHPRIAM